jgi:predicted MFS family arabinose efflux permease
LKTGGWARVAFAMFAVGWGANQFSPILIVYRHELHLDAGTLANLFAIYAAALIPGLLAGGPLSDRFGRRRVVIPFAVLSPVATLILVLAPHSVAALESGRALAGLCSGVVFGAATAWVRELSADVAISARRSALALTAGFGTGPVVAALLAQWAPHPRVVPYLPHLAIGATAAIAVLRVPETATQTAGHIRRWPPNAVRKPSFWLAIAPAAPWVFGSASLAFVVLPQEVTSANSLSVSFAGLMTALTLGSGLAIQTLARRIEGRRPLGASVAGLLCAAAGAGAGVAALGATSRPLAALSAVLFGASYGLVLVSGLLETERRSDPDERGAVVAVFYVLAYVGFASPYLVEGLNSALGRRGTFAAIAAAALLIAGSLGLYSGSAPAVGEQ